VVRAETTRQDVHWIRDCLKTPSGRRRLNKALKRVA